MHPDLRVLTYNTWLLDPLFGAFFAKDTNERAEAIGRIVGQQLRDEDLDIVVVQEAFQASRFFKSLAATAPNLHVVPPHPNVGFKVVNSGIAIISRFPVVSQDYLVFSDSIFPDSAGAKGITYAEILLNFDNPDFAPTSIHVFGTHMQADGAWDELIPGAPEEFEVRRSQLAEMFNYIQRVVPARSCPEPVIVAGDFNIDRGSREYVDMMSILNSQIGKITGLKSTSDPANTWKKGQGKSQYLDYVMHSGFESHAAPIELGTHHAYRLQDNVGGDLKDLSDHHPVLSTSKPALLSAPQPAWQVSISIGELFCEDGTESGKDDFYFVLRVSRAGQNQREEIRFPNDKDEWHLANGERVQLNLVLFDRRIDAPTQIDLMVMESDGGFNLGDDFIGRVYLRFDPNPDIPYHKDRWELGNNTTFADSSRQNIRMFGSNTDVFLNGLSITPPKLLTPNYCRSKTLIHAPKWPCD